MPFLNNIVTGINQFITQAIGIPSGESKLYGISEVMVEPADENGSLRYPSIIDNDGEVTKIAMDDDYKVIVYHKVESVINSVDAKSGYGTSRGNLTEAANMALMLFAFRRKTRKEAWWFEAVIKDFLPEMLKIEDGTNKLLQRSLIKIGNSSYDKLALLQREYSEVQLNYPDLMVLEMKYRIESTWSKGCFIKCGCEGGSGSSQPYIATEQGKPILMEN